MSSQPVQLPDVLVLNPYLHPDLVIRSGQDGAAALTPGVLLPAYDQDLRVGAGAYTGLAASIFGARVGYLDWVGDDPFGQFTMSELDRLGHDTRFVRRYRGHHMVCVSIPDARHDDATMVATYPPGWQRTHAELLAGVQDLPATDTVYVYSWFWSFSHPALATAPTRELVAAARRSARRVLLDPNWKPDGPPPAHELGELVAALPDVDVLLPNRRDAEVLVGARSPADTVRALLDLGPQAVVLTSGADGAYFAAAGSPVHRIAGPTLEVRDTVGAGDMFGGAFAAGGDDLAAAVAQGVATAAAAISGGLTTGDLPPDQIREHAARLLDTCEELT